MNGFLLASPALFWMVFFFIIPVLFVLVISFMTRSRTGAERPFTLEAYNDIFGEFYELEEIREGWVEYQEATTRAEQVEAINEILEPDNGRGRVFLRSIRIALISTVISLLLGYPLAFFISTRQNTTTRAVTLFLVILPVLDELFRANVCLADYPGAGRRAQ